VVLIVAESWGISTDDSLNQAFRQIYLSRHLEDRYNFRMGTTPFRGTTVFGESRELCHRDYGFAIETEPADSLQSCLPYAFRAAGYRAIGIHGNSGVLFSRNVWYPNVGFQETWFTPDFARQHLPRCPGFFPGICDAAITEWIGDSLAGPWKDTATFVYWMSLNSHLPVDRSTDPRAVLFCGVSPVTRDDDAVCSWYVLERRLHEAVATLASRTDIPPTEFMIVGDHTPPFAAENRRAEFSQTVVPYFLLEPKTIAVPAPR
jgi:phosphoglycerol transferase MdoB-like AlkP superfamily enzyme